MLALVVAVALSQCSADTECKGDRICTQGQCVDATVAAPVIVPKETPISRAAQLGEEIGQRKGILEGAPIFAPSAMLVSGVLLLVLGVAGAMSYGQASGPNLDCTDVSCWYGQHFGIPSMIAGVVLTLVGGINLPINIVRRITVPEEIRARERELAGLEGR